MSAQNFKIFRNTLFISNNHFQEDKNVNCLNDCFEKCDISTLFLFSYLFSEWKKSEINQRVDQNLFCNANHDPCNILPKFFHAKVNQKFILVIMNILSDLTHLFQIVINYVASHNDVLLIIIPFFSNFWFFTYVYTYVIWP